MSNNNSRRINANDLKREAYIQLPKWLITEPKYKELSNDVKIAYAILKDRNRLSIETTNKGKNDFVDENGDIYFVYTVIDLMDVLGMSDKTVTKVKKALIKAGLLEEVRQGQGKANRYYLLFPTFEEVGEKDSQSLARVETRKNYDSRTGENTSLESENLRPIKKDLKELDLSKFEEEYIKRARDTNIAFEFLNDFLQEKGVDEKTIQKTIAQLIEHELELFEIQNVQKQYQHMMDKLAAGNRIFDFAFYFAKGLKTLTDQSSVSKQHQQEQLTKYELAKQQKPQVTFYNWLEEY